MIKIINIVDLYCRDIIYLLNVNYCLNFESHYLIDNRKANHNA